MNLLSAVLVNLWLAGWAYAMVIAGLKARSAEIANSSRGKMVRESEVMG
jgi:hypothetical protein